MRRSALIVATASFLAITVPIPAAASPMRTKAGVFQAFAADGSPAIYISKTVQGYCYTGSLTIDRSDAWRCSSGNFLLDPCFSSAEAPGLVICPNIDPASGIEIRLTKPLPYSSANRAAPSVNDPPWAIETLSGRFYGLASGASSIVNGLRLNYFCGSGCTAGLWGYPNRKVKPWTILYGSISARTLTTKVGILRAWM